MLYHVHVAASRHEPLPNVADLPTIEADTPEAALESLKRRRIVAQDSDPLATVVLIVVVSYWPGGAPRHVLSAEVPVTPIHSHN